VLWIQFRSLPSHFWHLSPDLTLQQELSDLALSKGLPLHVDACFGGFMLPWLEKLGYPIPAFDFRVAGVTSISADIHKYGYTSKGASVILYRNAELRSYQYFAYASWPGGLFGSPSLTGSRPGGAIAAAWAALVSLGQDGYMNIARDVMNTTQQIIEGVDQIPALAVITKPDMTCVAIVSKDRKVNIHAVADLMEAKGWKIERQQYPDSIHVTPPPLPPSAPLLTP
jgi:sphinganine-1-phosphate aldolase